MQAGGSEKKGKKYCPSVGQICEMEMIDIL